jgi:hypothetical protein
MKYIVGHGLICFTSSNQSWFKLNFLKAHIYWFFNLRLINWKKWINLMYVSWEPTNDTRHYGMELKHLLISKRSTRHNIFFCTHWLSYSLCYGGLGRQARGLWVYGLMVMNIYTMAIMPIVYGHWPLAIACGY